MAKPNHHDPFAVLSTEDRDRLKRIKMLILDVDGVMTDGRIWWIEGTGWTRAFSVKDGYGLKLLMKAGIEIAVISGGDSKSVRERAQFLGIKHVYLGDENKLTALAKIMKDTGHGYEQLAFVGDDLFDIPVLEKVGFSATVPHAVVEVKEVVHYITTEPGGFGAVREIADLIRKCQ
ncbi:MAG: HAD family hydrolase [Deltaproteobacteria bacterium]|nr:HAD family hydrolase [Deltaproteobacteria bacterium]